LANGSKCLQSSIVSIATQDYVALNPNIIARSTIELVPVFGAGV
jgi:hypothetical protein